MKCERQAFSAFSNGIYRCLHIRQAVTQVKAPITSSMGHLIQTEVIRATQDTTQLHRKQEGLREALA